MDSIKNLLANISNELHSTSLAAACALPQKLTAHPSPGTYLPERSTTLFI